MKSNNNPQKNHKALVDYHKRQLELAKKTEENARQEKILSNLEKWVALLPAYLKNARPANLPKTIFGKIAKDALKMPYKKQVLVSSNNSIVSNFVIYSIVYELLRLGIAIPSEIKRTSLIDGYNNINGMFGSRKWKDYFFDSNAKVLIIEGSSKGLSYLGSKGEEQFWRELNEFTINNDKLVILAYTKDDEENQKELFIPILTGDSELNVRLIKKTTFIKVTEKEENEIETKQEETYRGL